MKILKTIALLLHYPDGTVMKHADALLTHVQGEMKLAAETRQALLDFINSQRTEDLLDLQADYVTFFDRGRSLSLHLFEHVHGESRDRGQAMVQLLNMYREQGLAISVSELPDYLPLYLEFCSLLPEEEARNRLREIEHLLQTLHGRLEERKNPYAVLFQSLLELVGLGPADEQLRHQIQNEERDDTPQAMDQAWTEEPVIFGPTGNSCGSILTNKGQAVPVDTSSLYRHVQRRNAS